MTPVQGAQSQVELYINKCACKRKNDEIRVYGEFLQTFNQTSICLAVPTWRVAELHVPAWGNYFCVCLLVALKTYLCILEVGVCAVYMVSFTQDNLMMAFMHFSYQRF